jgi:hypothetical protein
MILMLVGAEPGAMKGGTSARSGHRCPDNDLRRKINKLNEVI